MPFKNKADREKYIENYRKENKEQISAQRREYYQNNKEWHSTKNREYYKNNKERMDLINKAYYLNNKEQINTHKKGNRDKLREKVIKKLGYKCVLCGFNDVRALQIDHIHGNGKAERRKIGTYGIYKRVLELDEKELKDTYQLLCSNCNWIKRYELKEHS